MSRVAVFVDAGYFWVQAAQILIGHKAPRDRVDLNYPSMRSEFLDEIKAQFPDASLLRIYWYDGPGTVGKTDAHRSIEDLDDFKLRLGTRNGSGEQKAVDGLIIADLISLAQSKSIASAVLVSGDADLTPGVQAAQSLGIRVHLLSMGPSNATSPFLRAEVDQKKHWDDSTVKKFVSAKIPAAVTAIATATTTVVEVSMPSTTPPDAPKSVEDALKPVAADFVEALAPAQRVVLKSVGGNALPHELDAVLLTQARKRLGRLLTAEEKPMLRNHVRELLK